MGWNAFRKLKPRIKPFHARKQIRIVCNIKFIVRFIGVYELLKSVVASRSWRCNKADLGSFKQNWERKCFVDRFDWYKQASARLLKVWNEFLKKDFRFWPKQDFWWIYYVQQMFIQFLQTLT